ncbi:DUF4129 domain-containing protein [Arthrobacter sp.]|uniref:DUF4129 domain-containing protein n=1 Tax=Arthrobacter sp. TaxID=1667 RepID=UPI003A8FF655
MPIPVPALLNALPNAAASAAVYDPDRDTATRDLARELARREYAQALPNPVLEFLASLWSDFLAWVDSLNSLAPNLGWLVVAAALAAVIAVVVLFVRPRLRRRAGAATQPEGAPVGLDAALDAAAYRLRAERALLSADHSTAVLQRFRALVARAEERTLLDPQPGRTATEVALALAVPFGGEAPQLRRAAALFNAVHYGHHEPTASDARWIAEFEDRLATAAPTAHQHDATLAVPR